MKYVFSSMLVHTVITAPEVIMFLAWAIQVTSCCCCYLFLAASDVTSLLNDLSYLPANCLPEVQEISPYTFNDTSITVRIWKDASCACVRSGVVDAPVAAISENLSMFCMLCGERCLSHENLSTHCVFCEESFLNHENLPCSTVPSIFPM